LPRTCCPGPNPCPMSPLPADPAATLALLDGKIAASPGAFGFRKTPTGGHTARSMMLSELQHVTNQVPPEPARDDYDHAIIEKNILDKPTGSSRVKSLSHLRQLYALDPQFTLFRNLRRLAALDPASLPLLALICAFCRDPQLRQSYAFIRSLQPGQNLHREALEAFLESAYPGRFSAAMKKSLAQNLSTTWTNSSHIAGHRKKVRQLPQPRPVSAAYAVLAAYLLGFRGQPAQRPVLPRCPRSPPQSPRRVTRHSPR
jgi:hypothetical protein